MKVGAELPDDRVLHTAFFALASDESHNGARPLDLEHDTTGLVSLDHAFSMHRAARADEWFFYDGHSIVRAGLDDPRAAAHADLSGLRDSSP